MNFYVWWIVSVIASFGMELENELRLFKDVADEGYKIDRKRMSELTNQINPDADKISLIQLLIPGLNIFTVFKRAFAYNQIKPILLDELSVMGVLDTMSEEEKKEYQKKPTGLRAFIISLKKDIKEQFEKSITFVYEDKENKVECKFENGDIIITKISGPMSNLSEIRQKELMKEKFGELIVKAIDKYGDINSASMNLSRGSSTKIILSDEKIEEENDNKDVSSQLEQFEGQKAQLIDCRNQVRLLKEMLDNKANPDSDKKPDDPKVKIKR